MSGTKRVRGVAHNTLAKPIAASSAPTAWTSELDTVSKYPSKR